MVQNFLVKKIFIRPADPGNFHKVTRNTIIFYLGLYKQVHILVSADLQHMEGSGRGRNFRLQNWYILKI